MCSNNTNDTLKPTMVRTPTVGKRPTYCARSFRWLIAATNMHRCVVEAQPTRATSPPPHMAAMIDRDGQQIAHVPYVQICRRPVEIESIELSSRARAHARVMTNTHTRAHTVSLANVRAQRRTECVCVCLTHILRMLPTRMLPKIQKLIENGGNYWNNWHAR